MAFLGLLSQQSQSYAGIEKARIGPFADLLHDVFGFRDLHNLCFRKLFPRDPNVKRHLENCDAGP